ncbi:hypothetical protein TWF706_012000 [Orbilia oligospora]|nr:hypothetical protein TWF706_012000 [Orbilia oligospora]
MQRKVGAFARYCAVNGSIGAAFPIGLEFPYSMCAMESLNASADAHVIVKLFFSSQPHTNDHAMQRVYCCFFLRLLLHMAQKRSVVANSGILQPRYPNARCIKRIGFRRTSLPRSVPSYPRFWRYPPTPFGTYHGSTRSGNVKCFLPLHVWRHWKVPSESRSDAVQHLYLLVIVA